MVIALENQHLEDNEIGINQDLRKNIGVEYGDEISLIRKDESPFLEFIKLAASSGNKQMLQNYFRDAYRPCTVGDIYNIENVAYKVINTRDYGIENKMGIVGNETKIELKEGVDINEDDYIQPKLSVCIDKVSAKYRKDRVIVNVSIPTLNQHTKIELDTNPLLMNLNRGKMLNITMDPKKLKYLESLTIDFSIE